MENMKLNNNLECPMLGLGTFMLSPEDAYTSTLEALKMGYSLIDTATGVNTEIAAGVGMCVKRRRDISAEFHAGSVSAVISCVLTLWMHHAQ